VPSISPADATGRARAALGLDEHVLAHALLVHGLERHGDYYLVVAGTPDAAVGVATVDASSGEVGTRARLPGRGPHLTVTAGDAGTLAGLGGEPATRLVWRPSAASRSPLYPLWEVEGPHGPVYVDQQGGVWRTPPWEAPATRG
jgi:hypothetical protein